MGSKILGAERALYELAEKPSPTEGEIYAALGNLVSATLRMPGRHATRKILSDGYVKAGAFAS